MQMHLQVEPVLWLPRRRVKTGSDYPTNCTVAWSACTGLYMPRKSRRFRVP
jgi:hypothetical protein